MAIIPNSDIHMAMFETTDTLEDISVFSGDFQVVTTPETTASGQDLAALSVVGRVTASGEIVLCNPGASDGSQNPIGVTVTAVDASAAAAPVAVFRSGMFNPDALTWHAGFDTDAKKRLAFEASQPTIFIREISY